MSVLFNHHFAIIKEGSAYADVLYKCFEFVEWRNNNLVVDHPRGRCSIVFAVNGDRVMVEHRLHYFDWDQEMMIDRTKSKPAPERYAEVVLLLYLALSDGYRLDIDYLAELGLEEDDYSALKQFDYWKNVEPYEHLEFADDESDDSDEEWEEFDPQDDSDADEGYQSCTSSEDD